MDNNCPKGDNTEAEILTKPSTRFIKMFLMTFPKFEEKIDNILLAFSKHTIQRGNWNTPKNTLINPNKLAGEIRSQINTQSEYDETKEAQKDKGPKP